MYCLPLNCSGKIFVPLCTFHLRKYVKQTSPDDFIGFHSENTKRRLIKGDDPHFSVVNSYSINRSIEYFSHKIILLLQQHILLIMLSFFFLHFCFQFFLHFFPIMDVETCSQESNEFFISITG